MLPPLFSSLPPFHNQISQNNAHFQTSVTTSPRWSPTHCAGPATSPILQKGLTQVQNVTKPKGQFRTAPYLLSGDPALSRILHDPHIWIVPALSVSWGLDFILAVLPWIKSPTKRAYHQLMSFSCITVLFIPNPQGLAHEAVIYLYLFKDIYIYIRVVNRYFQLQHFSRSHYCRSISLSTLFVHNSSISENLPP